MNKQDVGNGLSLTELSFWDKYWSAKKDIGQTVVPRRYLFGDVLSRLLTYDRDRRFLEIGGFPGFYSIWVSKYLGYSCSLVDIYIRPDIIDALSRVNGTEPITTIQSDIFHFDPDVKFDVVMSAGLVEHFTDLPAIIERHRLCLRDGGKLIVCVPNFLGLNGLLQKLVDKKNFEAHNLVAMDLKKMQEFFQTQGFKDINSSYHGGFGIWIEEAKFSFRILSCILRIVNYLRVPFNVLGINTKYFSPYIVYTATK